MNKYERIATTALVASIGVSVMNTFKNIKIRRAKRKEIAVRKDQKLMAITSAQLMMERRINDGHYPAGSNLREIINDFDNEIIRSANEDWS